MFSIEYSIKLRWDGDRKRVTFELLCDLADANYGPESHSGVGVHLAVVDSSDRWLQNLPQYANSSSE